MTRFVLMGVAGCGKSSVGQALSANCAIDFIDGDDLHPQSNIDKMAGGQPLTDDDRAPWLMDVGRSLEGNVGPIVIGCSALKRSYRDWIRQQVSTPVHFLHLMATQVVLTDRMSARDSHFMPPSLLNSQIATLEQLHPDEDGIEIDATLNFDDVMRHSETYVREVLK